MKRADLVAALAGAVLVACGGGQKAADPGGQVARGDGAGLTQGTAGGDGARAGGDPTGAQATRGRTPQDAELLRTITPDRGFIDTPLAFDGAGGRILYVNTDAAELCDLVVHDLAAGTEVARVGLQAFTAAPLAVEDIDGEHFLVFARPSPEGEEVAAAVIDTAGKVVRSFGPATDLVRTTYDGEDALAVYRRREVLPKGKKPFAVHTIDVFALQGGKRLGKQASLTTDLAGHSEKLDFRINHWARGYTVAIGIKGGEYDRKEDQRSPDVEGWLDVPRATFSKRTPIADLIEHTRRMQFLAQHSNRDRFVAVSQDLSGVIAYTAGSGPTPVQLAETFRHYLHASLTVQDAALDEPLFFSLEIDPVHADAVEAKRAVEKWIDLYQLAPDSGQAVRVARLPVEDGHPGHRWRARAGQLAVVPRHVGFERGGPALQIYRIKAP